MSTGSARGVQPAYVYAEDRLNDEEFENFLDDELASYGPLLGAIRESAPPRGPGCILQQGFVLTRPLFLKWNLSLRITQGHMIAFDATLREAVLSRLSLPSSLPDWAILTFHQPIESGGVGNTEAALTCPQRGGLPGPCSKRRRGPGCRGHSMRAH